ncbi:MAG: DUF1343 domain-containing protein [Oligoflexia bacterium]|nr:DUF1343 domain-containing protein [Oligoflexia bacterium]
MSILKRTGALASLLGALTLTFSTSSAETPVPAPETRILPGAARLQEPEFVELLRGKRIAVLAHNASRLPDGTHLVDQLAGLGHFKLKMIFAPEHGYRSTDDELLPDSRDPMTGLPVYSLYGPRKAPTPEMLAQVDAVLIDLQDVGLRYYTYPATVAYTLRACKNAGKPAILLDRPIPIGGAKVEGAVLERALATGGLTNLAPIPTRHGMTLGELSLLLNELLEIRAELTVIPMRDWERTMSWDETGLPWVPPSPALTAPDQAELYAAFGTLESANLAVGRGKSNALAFRVYGAPWITAEDQLRLVPALQGLGLPGLAFDSFSWKPDRAIFQGKLCRGFRVRVTDSSRVESFRALIETMKALRRVLGDRLSITGTKVMLGSGWLLDGILADAPTEALEARAKAETTDFLRQRSRALLY